jgi:3-hydroxymyristoyl/3-hydroxydecanoyl-(acyl carrier protein) dehydratase
MGYERTVSISHDHPSLAGHFPGHPVVPGVVLLDEVLSIVREASGDVRSVTGLPLVKFSSPLRPGEVVTIHVDLDGATEAAFSCRVGIRHVASGTIELAPVHAASTERM